MKEYTKKTVEFYDGHVDSYIELTRGFQNTRWIEKFMRGLPESGTVLDVGCGFGRDAKTFAERGFRVAGIDASQGMIAAAKTFAPGATFAVMDASHLEFGDVTFDGVWCSSLLVHIARKDASAVIAECHRVLKKGGLFFIGVKEGNAEGFVEDTRYGGILKFFVCYTDEQMREILKEGGFTIVEQGLLPVPKEDYRDNALCVLARKPE